MTREKSHTGIGCRIRLVRENKRMSQQAFGETLGVTQSWLSELESGVKEPSDVFLIALEYRYLLNRKWLLTGEGSMERPLFESLEEGEDVQSFEIKRDLLISAMQALYRERVVALNAATSVAYNRGTQPPAHELFGIDEVAEMLRRLGVAPSPF